jgi:hypothetical protein
LRVLGDRNDLALETAFGDGRRGALLRLQRESVLLLAADAPLGAQVLRGDAHVADAEGVGQHRHHGVDRLGVAHPRAAAQRRQQISAARHHFHTAADGEIGVTQHDRLRRVHDRLLRRTAQAVHCEGHRIHAHAATDGGQAGNVGIATLGRDAVADRGERHRLRVDTGACDRFLDHRRAQIARFHVLQRATETAHCGTHGTQDDHFTICHYLSPSP